jgi:tetratricopeptide (TPR) repeat protein
MMSRADSLFKAYEDEQALDAYNKILEAEPRNIEALWHSSLLMSRLGGEFDSEDTKKSYFEKARKRAQRALDINAMHSNSNFAMSVAMGQKALVAGAKERVAASRDIKRFAERAIDADSSNAGAWHVLGRWNYEVANLNFAERFAANLLFGGIPDASLEEGAQSIKRAIDINPKNALYYYDLANIYKDMDMNKQATQTCKMGLQKQAKAQIEVQAHKDCRRLIDELN